MSQVVGQTQPIAFHRIRVQPPLSVETAQGPIFEISISETPGSATWRLIAQERSRAGFCLGGSWFAGPATGPDCRSGSRRSRGLRCYGIFARKRLLEARGPDQNSCPPHLRKISLVKPQPCRPPSSLFATRQRTKRNSFAPWRRHFERQVIKSGMTNMRSKWGTVSRERSATGSRAPISESSC